MYGSTRSDRSKTRLREAFEYYGIDYVVETRGALNISCPWCDNSGEKNHLGIFFDNYRFNCWKCKQTGSLGYLLRVLRGVDKREYAKWFGHAAAVQNSNREMSSSELIRRMVSEQLPEAEAAEEDVTWPPKGTMAVEKMDGDDLVETFIEDRKFEFDWLCDHDARVGITGRLSNRMTYPVVEAGSVVAYQARVIGNAPTDRKYLSEGNVSNYLYGYDEVVDGEPLIIVEGVFDAWRLSMGLPNVVASFTASLSSRQRQLLSLLTVPYIVLCWDGDKYWYSKRVAADLTWLGVPVYVPLVPNGEDPDSLGCEAVIGLIEKCVGDDEQAIRGRAQGGG